MYVWVIFNEHGKEPIYRFPCQVRRYAKEHGLSEFDEIVTRFDMIVFSAKGNNGRGFYALRRLVE